METALKETPRSDVDAPKVAPAIPAVMLWSGGKDSMLALHRVLSEGRYKIESLVTTVTSGFNRVSIHGVRVENLRAQAEAIGLPLTIVRISPNPSNGQYEDAMILCLVQFAAKGIKHVICGDLFLADVREYRERLFKRVGMQGVFPLWQNDTGAIAGEFISAGYKAAVCCVDPRVVPTAIAGREFDDALLAELPESCDPCGENGEFHSFVYDGPLFKAPVKVRRGETVLRDGFTFTDLVPV
jgi:uncharacterized protein (TIGR00290 family)